MANRNPKREIDIWCESPNAVKCYRLSEQDGDLLVRDLDNSEYVDGWTTLEDLMFELQLSDTLVWPTLELWALNCSSGGAAQDNALQLDEVIASLGATVPSEDEDEDN